MLLGISCSFSEHSPPKRFAVDTPLLFRNVEFTSQSFKLSSTKQFASRPAGAESGGALQSGTSRHFFDCMVDVVNHT